MEAIIDNSLNFKFKSAKNKDYKKINLNNNYLFRKFSDETRIHPKSPIWNKNKYIFTLEHDIKIVDKISIGADFSIFNLKIPYIPDTIIIGACALLLKLYNENKIINELDLDYNYIYWNCGIIQKSLDLDEQYMIETVLWAIEHYGYVFEKKEFTQKEIDLIPPLLPNPPGPDKYLSANSNKITKKNIKLLNIDNPDAIPINKQSFYVRLENNINHIKYLISNKSIIILGIIIYEDFKKKGVNILIYPENKEQHVLGVYNIILTGYNNTKKYFEFICPTKFDGIGHIPYEYILDENLSGDIYCII